ncbi:MAG: MBL fold metallo-hydrolase [Candidatus Bipolaricaulota bacterium]
MIFEKIESEGLAHYSYMIGQKGKAIVIDPRRDCRTYVQRANRHELQITDILETHRNEDYVIGSTELAARTEAEIWHADNQWNYQYGKPVEAGQIWELGQLQIKALHTPGHTPGHMSYVLTEGGGEPWMVFTGDSLFAGDVGRVDLLGMDRAEELAGKMYETLFKTLLPLGDGVIICPAHGPGSVCGSMIAERVWTTIGLEKNLNPYLQYDERDGFVTKVAKKLERPPYFREMERLNLQGAPLLGKPKALQPISPGKIQDNLERYQILDVRDPLGFAAAHIPGSLSIWEEGVPSFAGWFLSYEKPIVLVKYGGDNLQLKKKLLRLGFDDVLGYLPQGVFTWHRSGRETDHINVVSASRFQEMLQEEPPILDVRNPEELEEGSELSSATNIHLTQLPKNLDKVPQVDPLYVVCGSGLRSMTAASFLQQRGWDNLTVVHGGLLSS